MRDGFRREVRFQQDESRNKGTDGVDPGPGYSSAGCSPGTVKSGLNSGEKGWRQMVEGTQSARLGGVGELPLEQGRVSLHSCCVPPRLFQLKPFFCM